MNQINSIEQLREAGDLFHAIFAADKFDYQLSISDLSPSANQEISQQLNSYKSQCGCTAGSISTGIAILIIFCSYLTGIMEFSSINLKQTILLIAIIAAVATLGKAVSILRARIQMVLLIKRILILVESNHNKPKY